MPRKSIDEAGPLEIEVVEEIARKALDRDGGRSLTIRLAALDAATEQAARWLAEEAWSEAMSAWARVAFAAESLFGTDDPAVLDAMRITASIMRRLDLSQDATHLLCEVAERTLRAEGPEAPRLELIRAELAASLAA